MRLFLGSIAGLAFLGGCGNAPAPQGYAMSVEDAQRLLIAGSFEDMKMARQCGILIHIKPYVSGSDEVSWTVTSSGQKVAQFSAKLVPAGPGRIKAVVSLPVEPDGHEAYDGSQTYPRPAFNQPLRPAVEEQVAAILEQRPYEVERVPRGEDTVCNVQRGGLESGRPFSVRDPIGPATSDRNRAGWSPPSAGGWRH